MTLPNDQVPRAAKEAAALPRAEVTSVSTASRDRKEQWRYWEEEVVGKVIPASGRLPTHSSPEDGFDAQFTFTRIGSLLLNQPRVDAVAIKRLSDDHIPDQFAGVGVGVSLAGTHFVDGVRLQQRVQRGDVYAHDWAVPFEMVAATPEHHAFLIVPRARLDGLADRVSQHGRVFTPDQGLPQLFRYHMARLAALKAGQAPAYAELPDDIQDVAVALLDGRPERLEPLRPSLRRAQLAAVKDYVAKRAPLGDLPTERVAARFGMSPAHLERLFALEGTSVQDFARDCRLDACRQALSDPRFLDLTPERIARAFGFDDPARFHKAYRRRFGQGAPAGRPDL